MCAIVALPDLEKRRLKANLKPGTYLLLCNIKGHYKAGMFAKLVVTK